MTTRKKGRQRRGDDGEKDDGTTMTRTGATTPDEGTTALTQHPPRHSEHLLAWRLWALQRDDEGWGKDRDDNQDHNQDHNKDEEAPRPPLRAPACRVDQGC